MIIEGKTAIECKTVLKGNKRKLSYYNKKTKKSLPIVVGKRGGLSVKSRNAKKRRYLNSTCKKSASKPFWNTVKNMKNKL